MSHYSVLQNIVMIILSRVFRVFSFIKFVKPNHCLSEQAIEILANRERIYESVKRCNPNRWSGDTRNWERSSDVWLNPEKKELTVMEKLKEAA